MQDSGTEPRNSPAITNSTRLYPYVAASIVKYFRSNASAPAIMYKQYSATLCHLVSQRPLRSEIAPRVREKLPTGHLAPPPVTAAKCGFQAYLADPVGPPHSQGKPASAF